MEAGLSETVDRQRAEDARTERWRRLEKVLRDSVTVASLRAQGVPDRAIAERMGWSLRTLWRWLDAAEKLGRKGIRRSS